VTANEAGFLAMIRFSEGTARAPNPYAVTFGDALVISDFSDHPHALGWPGYPYRGIMETAAGAYQINYPTWLGCKHIYSAKDFSPAEQDRIALCLVNERRALPAINSGDIETAITLCSAEWASLPGSSSGQPQRKIADLLSAYNAGRSA